MYINSMGAYVPVTRVGNDHFLNVNGLTAEWIEQRTGIKSRSKCAAGENQHTMALEAVDDCLKNAPYPVEEVDLIVGAGYAVYDTVATVAHIVQRQYNIRSAKALYVTSACSSFLNALEVVQAFFKAEMASKALIVCSEHNTYYSNESDPKAGHLWGDAAVAWLLSKEPQGEADWKVRGIVTHGLGHVSKGPAGVQLKPREEGITMPDGRDVFINACRCMVSSLSEAMQISSLELKDLAYVAPHQANMRIIAQVGHMLDLPAERVLVNMKELGNTGSASSPLVITQNKDKVQKGECVGITVFGGGYSSGAAVIEK